MEYSKTVKQIRGAKTADELKDALSNLGGNIEDIPIMDFEPVVHCKDCRFCYESSTSYTGLRCEGWGTYNDNPCTESYWYCARGEKK